MSPNIERVLMQHRMNCPVCKMGVRMCNIGQALWEKWIRIKFDD